MRSSIKIDFVDRGTGVGIEPVIRIELLKSEDPRDTLLSVLFETTRYQNYLQIQYADSRQVATKEGLPDLEKRIYLFKPEINTDELMSIVQMAFQEWVAKEKYVPHLPGRTIHDEPTYIYGDTIRTESELFREFLSIKGTHMQNNKDQSR